MRPEIDMFFIAVAEYTAWNKETIASVEKAINVCETKPAGASHNANLHRDDRGQVWSEMGSSWHRLERSSVAPFSQYRTAEKLSSVS